MVSFERLIREHHRIGQLADQLRDLVDEPEDAQRALLALGRLADILVAHLLVEDAHIYPELLLSRDTGNAAMAGEVVSQFAKLTSDWSAYNARWTEASIAADWPRYRAETHAILARLADRIRIENELLYPMALRSAQITLREPAVTRSG